MVKRRSRPRQARQNLAQEFVAFLHAERAAGRCRTPLTGDELMRLAAGHIRRGGAEARGRRHLSECLYCLNAYGELKAAMASVGPTAPHSLVDQIAVFVKEFSAWCRLVQHRGVQRSYSEPSMTHALDRARAAILRRERMEERRGAAKERGDSELRELDLLERALRERLEEVRKLQSFLARERALYQRVRREVADGRTRQTLLDKLEDRRRVAFDLVPTLAERTIAD